MDPSQFPPTLEPPPRLRWLPLTLSLLGPQLVAGAGVLAMNYLNTGEAANVLLTLLGFVGIVCWLLFGHLLRPRFRGSSFWLLFLAYPFVQLSIVLAISAAACLVLVRI